MFKNVATKIALFAFDATTGAAKTGDAANLTAYVSKDYGSVTVLADTSATEMDATNAKGWYLFDVAQAESNADALLFTCKSTTANIAVVGQYIHTTPASFTAFVTPTGAAVNATQLAGQTITAAAGVTFPTSVASPTNITAGTIATVTTVTNDVGITQAGADKVWGTTVRALTDKVGFALSSAGVQAIWDALTSALTTVGSIGKLLVDNINATISSRMATFVYTAPLDAAGTRAAVGLATANLDTQLDALPTAAENADQVWDEAIAGHAVSGSTGEALSAAGAGGDPWLTALPGAYGSGTAGKIIGDNIDALISSRTKPADTQAAVTTVTNLMNAPTAGDLTAAMKASVNAEADTALSDYDGPTNAELATALGTADDAVLAQVALVKAKTDLIPASPAAVGDVPTTAQIADKILDRSLAGGADDTGAQARSVRSALRGIRNKSAIVAGVLTVRTEDDTTEAWHADVTTAPGDPLTSIDPA